MLFLIVKSSSLGDILHTFPVVSYLHQKFPNAKIDWVVEAPFSDLVSSHPLINRVITVDTKKWRRKVSSWNEMMIFRHEIQKVKYDVVFDFQGNIKSSFILSQTKSKTKVGFGRKTVSEWPNLLFTTVKKDPPRGLNIREDYLFLAQSYFGDSLSEMNETISLGEVPQELLASFPNVSHKVMVCPGAFWPNKQISLDFLIHFLQQMSQKKETHFFFAWGTQSELAMCEKLAQNVSSTVLPRLKLPVLQNVMGHMDLVIAMDSLPLHLAATTKAATLSFFGPSWAKKYAPKGERHQVFQGKCPYNVTFEKRCPQLRTCKTGACLKNIHLDIFK